jgi:alkylation response protein AidB-like acyl-CoA dehydrogenase
VKTNPLDLARELSLTIIAVRDETETQRRLAKSIVDRLRETGLCRMALVAESNGLEVPIPDTLPVYEALSYAEASVGWIVWNNALPCLFGRNLDAATRKEVFADRRWLYACSTRPTGRAAIERDGYRLSGRWSIVSGCELADWIMLLCAVEENGAPRMLAPGNPELRLAFVRRGSYEIVDTWHVGGLRGTGSHDVVVKDLHVPRRATVSPGDPSRLDVPHGRVAIVCSMAAAYGAQALGVAQVAIDTLVELTKTKVSVDGGPSPRERPAVLTAIAQHGAAAEAARAHLHACTTTLWNTAVAGRSPALEEITAVWCAALNAAAVGRNAVEAMYSAGGTNSLYNACPLERAHRDMHAMQRHIVGQSFWLEDAGRVKLGLPALHPLYAL